MTPEPNATQIGIAMQMLMLDREWRSETWLLQRIMSSNFDLKWAVLKRLKKDGTFESSFDRYGKSRIRLVAEWELCNQPHD